MKTQSSKLATRNSTGPLAGLVVAAWFIFSLSGESAVEEARLVSSQAYQSAEQCVATARLLQAGQLAPFFFCAGSADVGALPEMRERQMRLRIDGEKSRR